MAEGQSVAVVQQLRRLFGTGTDAGLDDGHLLARFVERRDEAAFATLLARHGPLVLGACRRLLADPADVEDAFQATFLVLVRKAASLKDRRLLGTWLYKVAYRVALRTRTEAVKPARTVSECVAPALADELERRELRAVIDEEVLRLPGRYRLPVVLCYLEGLSHEEAAKRLDCPLGTVNSRLSEARSRLRGRLIRRGLAPSAVLGVAACLAESARAEVPAGLWEVTARAALRVANGSAVAGVVSAKVAVRTEGVLRAMITAQFKMAAAAALAAGLAVAGLGLLPRGATGEPPARVEAAVAPPVNGGVQSDRTDTAVLVTGTVLMPDGSPAAGATVEAMTAPREAPIGTVTNDAGRFQLRGVFGNGGRLHASSADGTYQTMLVVPSAAIRTTFASPIELSLTPALTHEVAVVSNGRPVEGAQVVAEGQQFRVHGVTDRDGKTRLRVPANERVERLAALHRELGIGGAPGLEDHPLQGTTQLVLLPPRPHTIRMLDLDGRPIRDLELSVVFRTADSGWIFAHGVAEAHVHTDAEGMATVPWAPREGLQAVDVDIIGSDWKIDETDLKRIGKGTTTVRARRKQYVAGRLVMPEGVSAEGLLITGFGSGPKYAGDIVEVRARRDGTFALKVPADHAYVLGLEDMKWASDPWSGVILGKDSEKPAEIAMNVYPATSLTIRVTRGPRHDPVANAWVTVSDRGKVTWVDAAGKKRSGTAGASVWLWTDSGGVARTGVGQGAHELHLSAGKWIEDRTLDVASDKPVEVEFHRPWQGDRHITGRLMLDGARDTPSSALVARAWAPRPTNHLPFDFKPAVRPDGTFEVAFDAETVSLLFVDPQQQRSGFAQLVQEGSHVELSMAPTADYGGILLDENAQPLADRTLQLYVKATRYEAVTSQRTDKTGRFRFRGVPANTPLQLTIPNEGERSEYLLVDGDRMFNPGETRENDRVRPRRMESATRIARPAILLAKRVESACRDARLSGMRALVVLQGDTAPNSIAVTERLLDYHQVRAVLGYRIELLEAGLLKTEAATLAEYGWPIPAPGEIALVALNGDRVTIAAKRITTDKADEAVSAGEAFLKQHSPPTRNAPALLAAARNEAAKTGRRVWVVLGGPRCGPCFRLGRWMDDQHATLEKDYVIVKVMEGVDEQAAKVSDELPRKEQSEPWFAIAEPDGTVLATCEGPPGNIGCPDSVEGIRHFRQMLERTVRRLKSDEVDALIKSLTPSQ